MIGQPPSQFPSSSHLKGSGKTKDPGNEVGDWPPKLDTRGGFFIHSSGIRMVGTE